jgi:hypothetical protein
MITCTAEEHVLLGAFILGGLSPEDCAACREHLRRCRACGDELEALADLPHLLDLVGPPIRQVAPSGGASPRDA